MIELNGSQLAFFVDGTYWNLLQQDFVYLKIQRGVNLAVPILELRFNDRQQCFRANNITSGTLFSTSWTVDGKEKLYNWNISEINQSNDDRLTTQIVAYLHKPKWMRGIASPFYGTSYDAIKKLATDCDYKFTSNIFTTDDECMWAGNYTNYGMASEICSKGYVDSKSCMALATGLEAIAYNNVFATPNWETATNITDTVKKDSDIKLLSQYVKSANATSQLLYCYQFEVDYQGIDIENYIIDKTTFQKIFSETLPINDEYYKDVGLVRVEQYPLDFGNFHKNEKAAYYNNLKRKSQFLSSTLNFVNGFPKVSLLEQVKVSYEGHQTYGVVSNIITTFTGDTKSISSRVDVISTNDNVGA